MKYRVTLKFLYSDVVHVEADSKREAEQKALAECEEAYECFYESKVEHECFSGQGDG